MNLEAKTARKAARKAERQALKSTGGNIVRFPAAGKFGMTTDRADLLKQRLESQKERFNLKKQKLLAKQTLPGTAAIVSTASSSGYDPNAILETVPGAPQVASAAVPASASPATSTVSAKTGYSPSGYDPNAILEIFPPGANTANDPVLNQLASDPAMREKLLMVKQTNPEYYDFLAMRLPDISNINSSMNMGEDWSVVSAGAPTPANESLWAQLVGRVSKEYANYQLKKKEQQIQTAQQTQDKLLAAQQSDAILLGKMETTKMMYIFGGLALLAIAYLLTRKK